MKVVVFDKETGETSEPCNINERTARVLFAYSGNCTYLASVFLRLSRYEFRPVLEGVEVYVARGTDPSGLAEEMHAGFTTVYIQKPNLDECGTYSLPNEIGTTIICDQNDSPSIKPGECRKAKIVLEETE
jgi:hypothetical protein